MQSPRRVVGNGTDGHLAMGFHSPRLERPQEKSSVKSLANLKGAFYSQS